MRPVRCVETGEIYKNATEAEICTGVRGSSILKCCAGSYTHAGGFRWKFSKLKPRVTKQDSSQKNKKDKSEPVVSVKRQKDDTWAVFYQGTLLKEFKTSTCAYIYAADSAHTDAHTQGLVTASKPIAKKRVRHIESGKIYPSIRQASKELGISIAGISKVLRGFIKTAKGQHFEQVEEEWR